MARLITFGCSYTQGAALPDLPELCGPPSQYAWPAKLGKLLNVDGINKGSGGNSNLQILSDILNFKFEPDDICVTMWSHFDRDLLFREDGDHMSIMNYKEKARIWRKLMYVHTDYDQWMRQCIYFHHAHLHLLSKTKNHFFLFIDNKIFIDLVTIKFNVIVPHILPYAFTWLDKADDDCHPGIETHQELANRIYLDIKNKL